MDALVKMSHGLHFTFCVYLLYHRTNGGCAFISASFGEWMILRSRKNYSICFRTILTVRCGTINLTAGKYAKLKNACITCLDYSEGMQEILFYEIDLPDVIDAAHPSLLIS